MERKGLSNKTLLELLRDAAQSGKITEVSKLNVFAGIEDLPLRIIKQILSLYNYNSIREMLPRGSTALSTRIIREWMKCDDEEKRYVAISSCIGRDDVSLCLIEECFSHVVNDRIENFETLLKAMEGRPVPDDKLDAWANTDDFHLSVALASCVGRKTPLNLIEKGLERSVSSWGRSGYTKYCGEYAAKACPGQDIPVDTIREWLEKYDIYRIAGLFACKGRKDIPSEIIKEETSLERFQKKIDLLNQTALADDYDLSTKAELVHDIEIYLKDYCQAIYVFRNNLSKSQIVKLLNHGSPQVVLGALKICEDVGLSRRIRHKIRDIALDRKDGDSWFHNVPVNQDSLEQRSIIRAMATEICEKRGIALPLVRDFEPPALVYLRCADNVMVTASIPRSACVKGEPGKLCVANRAFIISVSGEFFYDRVGISPFRNNPEYRLNDYVEISNFDLCASPDRRTSCDGFYFYCDKEDVSKQMPFLFKMH